MGHIFLMKSRIYVLGKSFMNSHIEANSTIYFLNEYFFVILITQESLDPGDPELFTASASSNS